MSLLEQMQTVDRLVRRPGDLAALVAKGGPDAAVLSTIDPSRLDAVGRMQALLTLGRWWQPRFPAAVESLTGERPQEELALALVGAPSFERAEGEDVKGTAFVLGALELSASGQLGDEDRPWLEELLAYEYLLAIGLPRRAMGEDVDEALEKRLLAKRTRWFEGGRLARRIVALSVTWPVGDMHEGIVEDDEPAPLVHMLAVVEDEVAEVEAPGQAIDALHVLAAGGDDKAVAVKVGKKNATRILGWMRDAEMLK